jgi:hypothetical protein
MTAEIVSLVSGLGFGGLVGIFAKSALDKQQMKFTKVFDFKEVRYKALTILMLTATGQSDYAWHQLRLRRPEINKVEDLDNELRTEYYNAMLFASDKVLKNFKVFLADKTIANYQAVAHAMREDLYR